MPLKKDIISKECVADCRKRARSLSLPEGLDELDPKFPRSTAGAGGAAVDELITASLMAHGAVPTSPHGAAGDDRLLMPGDDMSELCDNQSLVDAMVRHAGPISGTAFALARNAFWTCPTCAYANSRSAAACADCRLPRADAASQTTALLVAARAGSVVEVLSLVAAAVPLDTPEAAGERRTALFLASQHGHKPVVEALLAAGADKDAKTPVGATSLHIASHQGHLPVVEALLAAGADKEAKEQSGATALVIASQAGHLTVVVALLAAAADKGATTPNGSTALHMAMATCGDGCLAVVQALLAAGVDKEAKTKGGFTALMYASYKGYLAVVEVLLAAGADKEMATDGGFNAHYAARQKGHLAVAAALLDGAAVLA